MITKDLDTHFIGQRVYYYHSLASTMTVAKCKSQQGAAEGTVVFAEEQTGGRGRQNRTWLSPRGSISLSIILRPALTDLPYLIMIASLAVVRSIMAVTGLMAQVKWPNDILLNGRKICGILIENSVMRDVVEYSIIGIGVNVNLRIVEFAEIKRIATSLSDELGREVSQLDMIRSLFSEMERLYLALGDGDSIYREWRGSLITLGKQVSATSGNTVYQGVAESVNRNGSLILRLPDGRVTSVVSGDVTLCN